MISLKCCNALWDSVKTRAIVNNSWCLQPIVLLTFQLLGSSVTCVQDALHDVTCVQDALQGVRHLFQGSQVHLQGVQANIAGTDFGAQLTSPGPKADLASSTSVGECISQEPALAPSRDAVTGTTGEWDKRDRTSELVLTLALGLHPLGQRPTWPLLPLWGSAQDRNCPGAKVGMWYLVLMVPHLRRNKLIGGNR